jgi:hypothetical protein
LQLGITPAHKTVPSKRRREVKHLILATAPSTIRFVMLHYFFVRKCFW